MNSSLACKSKLPALAGNCLIAAALALPAFNALAAAVPGDSAEGKRLYDASCTGCHDTGVFTRKTRSVQSLDALKQQLNSCGHASGKELSPAQKQDIVKYLNDQFYRFP